MKLIPNIIGYHTNDKTRCENFIKNSIGIFSEDTHWLGYGMYFWDNKSNATYWKDEKFRKHKEINVLWITQANIIIDEILDLTDIEVAKTFEKLWEDYSSKKGFLQNENNEIPIGKKIDMLFDFYDELSNEYKVIKCYGQYKGIKDLNIFYRTNNCKITNKVRVIYSVRDEKKISNPKLLEECLR